ncbi:MAG: hypothetical protein JOZ37_12505 [Actinobacteria bacterium]|nr:hypothetical protein [Actinomycetota bacterium]MBV9253607.1 hypothetical protein [Actinomycetota bacterium]MBV9664780.1 hypothetical protein [Actinomycetota bacterium]MBV9934924.1 hypothetical protein [Actinomycetota bacterium]
MVTSAVVWTYWMSVWLLGIGTVVVVGLAVAYVISVVRPSLMWKQWQAEQESQMAELWAAHRAQADEIAALRSAA